MGPLVQPRKLATTSGGNHQSAGRGRNIEKTPSVMTKAAPIPQASNTCLTVNVRANLLIETISTSDCPQSQQRADGIFSSPHAGQVIYLHPKECTRTILTPCGKWRTDGAV
jgi:hypothetical protein